MKSWTRLATAALVAASLPATLLFIRAFACSPGYEPEVFVPEHHPAQLAPYISGQLGILQRGYYHAELVVAYRYLSGGRLSEAEKRYFLPAPQTTPAYDSWQARAAAEQAARPVNRWRSAHDAYKLAGDSPPITPDRSIKLGGGNYTYDGSELNCTDGAFEAAVATLQSRAKTWGATSPVLADWLRGQDAVFSNCDKAVSMPAPAPADAPLLLKQDRAYQMAAAQFYQQDFDDAIEDFAAIGHDKASPWNRWGEYLAARAEVRKAFVTGKAADFGEQASFDKDSLMAAQARLVRLLNSKPDAAMQHAAMAELHFVQVRLDPTRRLDDAAMALGSPDPDFAQDLADLDVLLDRGTSSTSELTRWIVAMQSGGGDGDANPATLPWLVADLSAAQRPEPALLSAVEKLPADSPAYETISYHRARLLLSSGKREDARALLDSVLRGLGPGTMASTRNAFLQQRMQTARTLNEFLADAPRRVIETGSGAARMAQCANTPPASRCSAKIPEMHFDSDSAAVFNKQMPLALWNEAANSKLLPENLRQAVAWAGWLRALGLGDRAMVGQLSPSLPDAVRKVAGDSDGFPATLALLRNPGIRPYIEQGVQRSVTYSRMDGLRDNWWCAKWGDGAGPEQQDSSPVSIPQATIPAEFLTARERQAADAERTKLNALPNATIWLGERAIAYVKAHPQDENAAEALALTVRATHYSCSGEEKVPAQQEVSKQAFELLHRLYPQSTWALNTKYYY